MKKVQKRLSVSVPLLLVCVLFSGCKSRLGDFTVITTKNIDLKDFNTHEDVKAASVVGEDVKHIIFVFPTGVPHIKEAVDQALDKGNAYMLVDAALYHEWFYIPYFYGYAKYEVKGTPAKRGD
ncbi:MAG: hypothetical protein A2Z25_01750 [Planctomycetes bacterium RBG_16_55_9]|nr:MAG: hypothetical protein A2Z25_01750 [Planctomycetes bacterium RBG_16_55_9]